MSEKLKSSFLALIPTIIVIIGWTVLAGVVYGKIQSELEFQRQESTAIRKEMMTVPERMQFFVPRKEYEVQTQNIEKQISEIKQLVKDTNDKVDKLYQQRIGSDLELDLFKKGQ